MKRLDNYSEELIKIYESKRKLYNKALDKFLDELNSHNLGLETEPLYDGGIITYLMDYENNIADCAYRTPDDQYGYPESIEFSDEDEDDE